jgi:hypothetical protein
MQRLKELNQAERDHEKRIAALEAKLLENNSNAGLIRESLRFASKLSLRDGYHFLGGVIVTLAAVVLVFIFKK